MRHLSFFGVFVALCALCQINAETHNITLPKVQCDDQERASTILDVAKDFVNKAKDLYPNCITDGLQCGRKEKSLAFLDVASNLISQVKNNFPTCPETKCPEIITKPMDCSEILLSGKNESGIYIIWPRSRVTSNKSVVVYCDMDTDGGGWTVFQRRGNFSTPKDYFYKDWKSYKIGFGEVNEEFWLGDSLAFHNNMKFSTKDRKNDLSNTGPCAVVFQGAWWYNACHRSGLNGLNMPGQSSSASIIWHHWRKFDCMAETEMKLRPR